MQQERLSKLLCNQRDELTERINKIKLDLGSRRKNRIANQHSIDHTNDDVLTALIIEAQAKLDLTQVAINHLGDEISGICTECGNKISDDRLSLLPHTQVCRECAKKESVISV